MEGRISQKELELLVKLQRQELGLSGLSNKLQEIQVENKINENNKTVFLSHSHLDKTIIEKIKVLFISANIEVYIDWNDKMMPEVTNTETANRLIEKIEKSNVFLFLATTRALSSRWCNWELGLAQAALGRNKIAILPVETRSGNWPKNEYLGLYKELKVDTSKMNNLMKDDIYFIDEENMKLRLTDWINNN